MTDLELLSLVIGFFMPIIVAAIQQPKWSSGARAVITFLVCVIAGGVTVYFKGGFTGQRIGTSALLILVAAIATYKGLWQPTGIAPAVEKATTPNA